MNQKERSRKSYENRKNNGLCPKCGRKLDRQGYYCNECLEKNREYRRENRKFYIAYGLCSNCGKEKVFGSEKQCISCREKSYLNRKPPTEEQKKRQSEKFKEYQKNLYKKRSEEGICTRCGKTKAAYGRKKCFNCLSKDSELHKKRIFSRKDIKEYRKENNLCYHCGAKIENAKTQICSKCLERCKENGLKSRHNNEYWKADNRIIFKNYN